MSVFSLAHEPGHDTVIDYGELAAWLDKEVSARRISPMVGVTFAHEKNFDYCFIGKSFSCIFLRETPLSSIRFQAQGYLIFRLILSGGIR